MGTLQPGTQFLKQVMLQNHQSPSSSSQAAAKCMMVLHFLVLVQVVLETAIG